MHALCVPPDVGLPSHRIAATKAARRCIPCRQLASPTPIETQFTGDEIEMENMPGTPPLLNAFDKLSVSLSNESDSKRSIVEETKYELVQTSSAIIIQRRVRCLLAKRERATLCSAVGRPAEIVVRVVDSLELFCDYRDVVSMYCIIRVLKKPFGPFMFQFKTNKSSSTERPVWQEEKFFVPVISSRCLVVVTLIGTTTMGQDRFLGQSVAPLETGWELHEHEMCAPLGKWQFPLDEDMMGIHRFVKGQVHCIVRPYISSSSTPCHCGQFQIPPVERTDPPTTFFNWSRRKSLPGALSPEKLATPTTPSTLRKEMITRWGVLTDTHLHLFDHTTAQLSMSLDLGKLQMIRSVPLDKTSTCRREPNHLFPLKIYSQDTLYTLYVSTYAQVLMWEYKIDLHRRRLLVP